MEKYSFDTAYVCRLKDGDIATQRHFTRYFGELLSIKLRSRLRSPHLVEEARQETFLRVLTTLKVDGLDQPDRLGAFVNSVCNNVLFELYRAESRTPQISEDAPEPLDARPDPESGLVTRQRRALVERALEELQEKDRVLIRQIFLEERDKDEVCRDLQVDRDYLRVLLHRAKSRLKTVIEEQHPYQVL